MKLLFLLILLPFGYFASKAFEPVKASEEFIYELTVNSPNLDSAHFDLTITGFSLSPNETRIPIKLKKENLTTPYKTRLSNGKYTVIVDSKEEARIIISKVQGIENGKEMGFASGESKKTILDFGFKGNYSAREE